MKTTAKHVSIQNCGAILKQGCVVVNGCFTENGMRCCYGCLADRLVATLVDEQQLPRLGPVVFLLSVIYNNFNQFNDYSLLFAILLLFGGEGG